MTSKESLKGLLFKAGYWLMCVLDEPIFSPSVAIFSGKIICIHCGKVHSSDWKKRLASYIRNRFYFRGYSWLGILNTIAACLFNRVLVRHVDNDMLKTVGWSVKRGTDFPKA